MNDIRGFEKFNFNKDLLNVIYKIGFRRPTLIQEKVIPKILSGNNIIAQSATGSGKSHAFLLPIFNNLDFHKATVQAVITVPSRELAFQLKKMAKQLADLLKQNISIRTYVGGTDRKNEIRKLSSCPFPQIIIGTPGRILDLIESHELNINTSSYLVIDEADMTLDMGFISSTSKIIHSVSKSTKIMFFSATINNQLENFLKKNVNNIFTISIKPDTIINSNIDNWLIPTKGHDKNELIFNLLKINNPFLAVIFANTKDRVDEIYNYLISKKMKVAKLHGGLQPRERKRIIRDVENLKYRYVVATDLVSRGIDIKGVSHIINDDIPDDLSFFIHRVGRTARYNMSGIAETLYEPGKERKILKLEKMGIRFKNKKIVKNQIIDSFNRKKPDKSKLEMKLSPKLTGLVKKAKKDIKPGYKKKIKKAIKHEKYKNKKISLKNKKINK